MDNKVLVGFIQIGQRTGKPSGTGSLFPVCVSLSDSEPAQPFLHLACLPPLLHPVKDTTQLLIPYLHHDH